MVDWLIVVAYAMADSSKTNEGGSRREGGGRRREGEGGRIASYPGSVWAERRAWYPLYAHASKIL